MRISFRLKEERLIIGLPYSHKLYTSISGYTFIGCYSLTSATIGNNMTKLVDAAYYTPRQFLRHQPYFYHSTTCTTKEPI